MIECGGLNLAIKVLFSCKEDGYTILPNGVIVQKVVIPFQSNNGTRLVNFPVVFQHHLMQFIFLTKDLYYIEQYDNSKLQIKIINQTSEIDLIVIGY